MWQRWQLGQTVAEALNSEAPTGLPVHFARPLASSDAQGYEAHIAATGCVPTRDIAHDLFNGLAWCTWPQLKLRLNQLHQLALQQPQTPGRRGPLRDALTLFDESGAVLQAPAALSLALRERRWGQAFGPLRPLWRTSHLWVVGHALMEQLCLAPRKALTAHVLHFSPVAQTPGFEQGDLGHGACVEARKADDWACGLCASAWAAKPFWPLPVLGVPGWWAANDDPQFYADAQVFRPQASTPSHGRETVDRAH